MVLYHGYRVYGIVPRLQSLCSRSVSISKFCFGVDFQQFPPPDDLPPPLPPKRTSNAYDQLTNRQSGMPVQMQKQAAYQALLRNQVSFREQKIQFEQKWTDGIDYHKHLGELVSKLTGEETERLLPVTFCNRKKMNQL